MIPLGCPPMRWYFPAFHLKWSLPLVKHSATPGLYSVSSHPTTLGGVTQPPLPYVILIPPFPAKKLFWCNLRFQNGFGNWFFILYGYPPGIIPNLPGWPPPCGDRFLPPWWIPRSSQVPKCNFKCWWSNRANPSAFHPVESDKCHWRQRTTDWSAPTFQSGEF